MTEWKPINKNFRNPKTVDRDTYAAPVEQRERKTMMNRADTKTPPLQAWEVVGIIDGVIKYKPLVFLPEADQ